MLFVATLTHPPEQCFAREEYLEDYENGLGGLAESAKELDVKVNGAYLTPNEHTFYFVLKSESVGAISKLLGPPMLTHSEGSVSPVIDILETWDLAEAFKEVGK